MGNKKCLVVFFQLILLLILLNCSHSVQNSTQEDDTLIEGPDSLSGIAGDSNVKLYWTPIENAEHYFVYWEISTEVFDTSGRIKSKENRFTHKELENGTAYYYRVSAVIDGKETKPSYEIVRTPIEPTEAPNVPENVKVIVGNKSLTVQWEHSQSAASYSVFWEKGDLVNKKSNIIETTDTSVKIKDLTNENIYSISVMAVNKIGESALSKQISEIPQYGLQIKSYLRDYGSFGTAMAMSDKYMIVGTDVEHYSGFAVIYEKESDGNWKELQRIEASDVIEHFDDDFGTAVDIYGDYIVVGADHSRHSLDVSGAAFVFKMENGRWTEIAKLEASDESPGDEFGSSVAIEKDVIMIGATGQSAVYVFQKDGEKWKEVKKIKSSFSQAKDVGAAIDLSGKYGVVTAMNGMDSSVYILERNSGQWDVSSKVTLPKSMKRKSRDFGESVAILGDYLFVGDTEFDDNDDSFYKTGGVYIFKRNGNQWVYQSTISASDKKEYRSFGSSIAVSKNYIVVGAVERYNNDEKLPFAATYIFKKSGEKWKEFKKVIPARGEDFKGRFGLAVTIHDKEVIIGAPENNKIYRYMIED